ncbi:ATP phosphoribosyltransferase regulatory subunit [Thermosyntropha lipolytica DSM 11003]|uniref:ATP phosphoribosyltransferase regulatory subunit n=1 Tax=Thermosyntropha lipolytica DSM 11003 TaxID=1123382 RepID=A0A1M5J978_9FIRM|nr:ATP phosphoribosyltransferase regulatory subunit [Thermosyntropha lipolytica]SHG37118.1 ATP phosphoribosyltransferase regulatory subunit [Thermosyntropha lipolytica DSM 11003]
MKNKKIPKGLRDLLPEEVRKKRIIEARLISLFASYGYKEVITPTFEYLEVIEAGTGNIREELFLFLDREGGILSLRPEMTVSIARLASIHLAEEKFPQRLCYIANVFRHVQPQLARYREFWQAGIELLGASGVWADVEVISLAVKALKAIGVKDFKVSINQIGIFNSLLEDGSLDYEDRVRIRELIEKKDLVELTRLLESMDIDEGLKETLVKMPVLHGGLEILDQLPYIERNARASAAALDLIEIYEALKLCGVIENIVVDTGVLRGLDYYTGIVFEGYSPDLGYGLLGGGRYDNLLGKFGLDRPATGFAIGIDRLALIVDEPCPTSPVYLVGGRDIGQVMKKCEELRLMGYVVEMDVERRSRNELEEKAGTVPGCQVVYID